jgi:hypothetical protein
VGRKSGGKEVGIQHDHMITMSEFQQTCAQFVATAPPPHRVSPRSDSSRHERTSPEGVPLSRAMSRTSALSNHQGLVKRSIEMHDLKPPDVLLEWFTAWKDIVR